MGSKTTVYQLQPNCSEFVDRTKESLKEFDSSVLISLIRAETNLDESPLFGGLDLAKAVVDEVVEE